MDTSFRLAPFWICCSIALSVGCSGTGDDGDDTGTVRRDAGSTAAADAGENAVADAGANAADAGDTMVDSGTMNMADAGMMNDRDAGMMNTPDAGMMNTPDAGMMNTPDAGMRPTVCNPTFGPGDACGGNPVGTWTYNLACTDQNVFASLQQACPGMQLSNQIVSTGGTVELRANNTFTRNVSTDVTANSTWPAICAQAAGGCVGLQATINSSGTNTAACTQAGAGCDCVLATTVGTFDNGNYVLNGNIVIAEGLEYYFCEGGSVLEYRGTANNSADNLFTFVLTP